MALRLRRGTDAERLTITPLEGELIYTTDTKKLFIGDGSTAGGSPVDTDSITDELADLTDVDLTGLADGQTIAYNLANTRFEPANLASAVNDLTDVDTSGVSVGDVLKWNGAAFVPGAEGAITEGATYAINIDGDLTGSVFGDDSSLLVDGINGVITGAINSNRRVDINGPVSWGETNTDVDIKFDFYSTQHGAFPVSAVNLNNVADSAISNEFTFYKARGTIDAQTSAQAGDSLGGVSWAANDGTGGGFAGAIYTVVNSVSAGDVDADILFRTRQGAIFPGAGEAFRVKGDKGVVAQSYVQFGSLTYAERDALTAVAGMVIWNSDSTQFEGYDGTNWINLVDGATSTAP